MSKDHLIKVKQEPVAWRKMCNDGAYHLFYQNVGWKDSTGFEPLYVAPLEMESILKERNNLKSSLNIQTKAADHWMQESCKDHNSMIGLKEAAKLAFDALQRLYKDMPYSNQINGGMQAEDALTELKKVL